MSKPRKGASRLARTLRSLIIIAAIGGGLAAYNIVNVRRDVALATGPTNDDQRAFFARAAERPDLELFYKGLTSAQRASMARRLGDYDDPRLAAVIVKLLGTFDPEARKLLGESLAKLAQKQPDAVADQLAISGSFQQLAVTNALKGVGERALPLVAKRLEVAGARTNAVAFLVESGPGAIPELSNQLRSENQDVSLAAADALGKLGAREAVPILVERYRTAKDAARIGYLSAIASIGDPSTEKILTEAMSDETLTIPQRMQGALGLGRVGTATAVATLAPLAEHPDRQFRESVRSALALAGDAALKSPAIPPSLKLIVAGTVATPTSDAIIAAALKSPASAQIAAEGAGNRPSLVLPLLQAVKRTSDGAAADEMLRALATTKAGRAQLAELEKDPSLGGLAARRNRIGPGA